MQQLHLFIKYKSYYTIIEWNIILIQLLRLHRKKSRINVLLTTAAIYMNSIFNMIL